MKHRYLIVILLLASCSGPDKTKDEPSPESWPGTVRLLPSNPRYLEYRNEPVILITSAEHYGALLNLDFDFNTYLQTLREEGFNYTRIFSGTYIEPVDNIFGIERNTLAPLEGRFIAPWVMENGKYDLERFNEDYFTRLRDLLKVAEQQGIIVELTLFTSIYAENAWALSPFNPRNNVNQLEEFGFRDVNTPRNNGLKQYQESFVRKMVRELNGFDNLFYEIQNEPWSDNGQTAAEVNLGDDSVFVRSWQKRVDVADGDAMSWQSWIASLIRDEEADLPKHHLIAQNISNFVCAVEEPPAGVSILNFHYALPEAVTLNRDLGVVIGLDETGFMPHSDQIYINQAWRFILSGGGLYNNLDYSFTTENERGEWAIPDPNPGWGGTGFRKKLSLLAGTVKRVPFHEMTFSDSILSTVGGSVLQYGLQKTGGPCLVFLEGAGSSGLVPRISPGRYRVTWINVRTGEQESELMRLKKGTALHSPFPLEREAVLLIEQTNHEAN